MLLLLMRRGGRVVSREELREELWPDDTFVDFDHGINTAMQKLRCALNDSTSNLHFARTVPRRGYIFIAPVEFIGQRQRPAGRRGPLSELTGVWNGVAEFFRNSLGQARNQGSAAGLQE